MKSVIDVTGVHDRRIFYGGEEYKSGSNSVRPQIVSIIDSLADLSDFHAGKGAALSRHGNITT